MCCLCFQCSIENTWQQEDREKVVTIRKAQNKAGQILVSHLQWQNSPEAHKELLSPKYADNQLQCLQPTLKWY